MTNSIPVGSEGHVYPDGSVQQTAGVQPVDGERAFVSKGGDSGDSGLTSELPKNTIMEALGLSGPTSIQIADGIYDEQVVANDGVDLNGIGASILNTTDSVTALKAAGSQQNRVGFVGSFSDNSIVYEVDGIERNLLDASTMSMGTPGPTSDTGITGIKITGVNDDIQMMMLSCNNNADGSTLVDITGESETAIAISLGNVTNFNDGFTGIDCKSSDADQIVNVNFNNFANGNGVSPTGVTFCTGTNGNVILRGANAVMFGQKFVSVGSGLSVDVSMSQVIGVIECLSGGELSISKLGLMIGALTIETGGIGFGDISRITGNVTIEAGATYDGDFGKVVGDFTVGAGATYDGIVLIVTGTVTIDPAATVNGIINGVPYGSYVQDGLGYTLQWGGNLQNTGRFARVSDTTSGSQQGGLDPASEYIVPADGTLDCLTYNSGTGNNTTVFKIWKNGGVEHTFTATGAGGVEAGIGLAVVAGDLIAIEYDAGMRPAGSVYVAYID